ncbi:hypothetical protein Tco_0292167 [Tanacetum coccineum]
MFANLNLFSMDPHALKKSVKLNSAMKARTIDFLMGAKIDLHLVSPQLRVREQDISKTAFRTRYATTVLGYAPSTDRSVYAKFVFEEVRVSGYSIRVPWSCCICNGIIMDPSKLKQYHQMPRLLRDGGREVCVERMSDRENFEQLKRRLVSAPIIDSFPFRFPVVFRYTACIEERLGCDFFDATWEGYPAYASRQLNPYESQYHPGKANGRVDVELVYEVLEADWASRDDIVDCMVLRLLFVVRQDKRSEVLRLVFWKGLQKALGNSSKFSTSFHPKPMSRSGSERTISDFGGYVEGLVHWNEDSCS